MHATISVDETGRVTEIAPSWQHPPAGNPYADAFFEAVRAAVSTWSLAPAYRVHYRINAAGEKEYERTERVADTITLKFTFSPKDASSQP